MSKPYIDPAVVSKTPAQIVGVALTKYAALIKFRKKLLQLTAAQREARDEKRRHLRNIKKTSRRRNRK